MPRQPKWVAAGIYQPSYRPRRAYGPRRWGRCELVEDYEVQASVLDAKELARYGAGLAGHLASTRLVAVPMPRGGVRWLLTCPHCNDRVTRLYMRYHPGFRTFARACRRCWGLRYRSQYEGRRMEAHPDYLQAVARRQLDRTPHEPRGYLPVPARRQIAMYTHVRRLRRYATAQELHTRHTQRWIARKDLAEDISLMILLARSEAQQRRRWQKILNQLLWPGHTPHIPTLQSLIALKDTPEWARTLLKQHLERAEKGLKAPQNMRKVVQMVLESVALAQSSTVVNEVVLDEMRTRYAALSQGRRAKRAA